MQRWVDKVAIVTGASAGIGEAIAITLVENGVKVVGLARRLDKMQKITEQVASAKGTFYPIQCDVTKEEDILKAFKFANTLGGVDILINNAGIAYAETVIDGTTEKYRALLDLNVVATAICTREAIKSMRARNVEGHVININSVCGHDVNEAMAPLNLYASSKYAVTAMTKTVRNELVDEKLPIKITSLSPGLVRTDLPLQVVKTNDLYKHCPHLLSKDVADATVYILGTPLHVQVTELTIIGSALLED